MLYRDVVHGDLSAYNILVWDGEITLIDFPQAVDPKKNRHAQAFLERDVVQARRAFRHGADCTGHGAGSRTICGPPGCSPTSSPKSSEA